MSPHRSENATTLLIDSAELGSGPIATAALLAPIDKPYSFRVPESLAETLRPGMRIKVPFGRGDRTAEAFCVSISDGSWDSTLKPVLSLIDERPLLGDNMLELGDWIARYYACPLGRTLDMMVPAAAKNQVGWKRVRYARAIAEPSAPAAKLTRKRAVALNALRAAESDLRVDTWLTQAGCGAAVGRALEQAGLVCIETRLESVDPEPNPTPRVEPDFELNADQKTAVGQLCAAVDAAEFSVQVLFGVTGSGKTECYVRAIRRALKLGRQAIMLVPEIALTTQTVQRLQARFERLAVVHSGLTGVQRSRTWAAIAAGTIPVVVGTRSAVFAPCPDLGIIIVDEEQETGYKNQAAPRFHSRDVAIKRGHLESVPVLLGSATPSLETWHNLQHRPHYHLIRLPHRVRNLAMPTVQLVDMRNEHRERRGVHLLSRAMEQQLTRVLQKKEQAVLLLNRRGFASFLHCPRCKTAITCPHCSVHMVLHATTELAHCHFCRARLVIPNRCQMAGCGGTLARFGIGVQRVEAELRDKFPNARLRRLDSDTMNKTSDYAEALSAFERKEYDILVGTQMIAKGLDFPFVSFVGVVSADTALSINDFRAEERTFQLVLQVAGRSGRGDTGGQVVVQTFEADADPIRHAVQGDYEGFVQLELAKRHHARLPPVTRLVRILLSDPRISTLSKSAEALSQALAEAFTKHRISATVFDAQPSPIPRIRDRYRYEVLITFPTAKGLLSAIELFKAGGLLKTKCRSIVVDVDPVSLQ